MERISNNEISEIIENFNKRYEGLGNIINPILEKQTLDRNRVIELCQVAKYVHLLDEDIKIIDNPRPPAPDFILQKASKQIGLEHTRLYTDGRERYLKIVSLVEVAENIYKEKYSSHFLLASIEIKNDRLDYKKNEKKQLATEIAEIVYKIKNGDYIDFPNYIEDIRISKHSRVSFTYKEQNFQAPYLTKERLIKGIRKKENKIKLYKKSKFNIENYWLILLVGSLSSVSYQINKNIDYRTNSIFDRVYLMADFSGEIIKVK